MSSDSSVTLQTEQAPSYEAGLASCFNPCMDQAAKQAEALRALCDSNGGYRNVAMLAGVSAGNLWQIINGTLLPSGQPRGVGRRLSVKLEKVFPGWMESQHASEGSMRKGSPVAHPASHPANSDLPLVSWEDLMTKYLPSQFRVQMTDDSMAPWLLLGDLVKFDRDLAPVRGQPVLLKDLSGAHYVRIYRVGNALRWTAAPLNPSYEALDSERDGLTVVGVFAGMDRP